MENKHQYWLGKKHSKETIKKMSLAKKGKKFSEEHKNKMKENHKGFLGRKHSKETRELLSRLNKGDKCSNWKGGISPLNKIFRRSIDYRLWREAVFARDNWTCQECGKRGGIELHPHHIKSFSKYPELRLAIDNGVTLCSVCHKQTDNYGGRNNNSLFK